MTKTLETKRGDVYQKSDGTFEVWSYTLRSTGSRDTYANRHWFVLVEGLRSLSVALCPLHGEAVEDPDDRRHWTIYR